jgi:hypothetical protein
LPPPEIPKEFLARAKAVTAKRAKTVIDHILTHGSVTTEELRQQYGYADPRRAIQDVKDAGIPLERIKVKGSDGRSIGAHQFKLDAGADCHKLGSGRKAFPKKTKEALLNRDGPGCAICGVEYESHYLQVDHRVPYAVAGDSLSDDLEQLMLVCGSCNRRKSWSCEHCANCQTKVIDACQSCYWASPKNYQHEALVQIRRVDLGWKGDEVKVHDKLRKVSEKQGVSMQDLLKKIIKDSALLK